MARRSTVFVVADSGVSSTFAYGQFPTLFDAEQRLATVVAAGRAWGSNPHLEYLGCHPVAGCAPGVDCPVVYTFRDAELDRLRYITTAEVCRVR